jgi:hypothetical protein
MQTKQPKAMIDEYKEDWEDSFVFKRCLRNEAVNHRLNINNYPLDEEKMELAEAEIL